MSKGLELAKKPLNLTGWFIYPSTAEKIPSRGEWKPAGCG
jgi:hypothetical protein